MRLKIPTKENRSYYLWEKSNLLDEEENGWQLMMPIPLYGNNSLKTINIDIDSGITQRFFKVEVRYP